MQKASGAVRDYIVNYKMVVLAYTVETIIALASLIGGWLFAEQYGHHENSTIAMMMLAPIAYAVVEFCRVPLAISIRTQTSFVLRGIALVGVLGAGSVTIKSMSQLGEVMFRPRLVDVVHAKVRLADAQSASEGVQQRIDDADAFVEQRRIELRNAEQQVTVSTEKLAGLPKQECLPRSGVTADGRAWKDMRCSQDQRIAPFVLAISNAANDRKAATERLTSATAERGTLDRAATDANLRTEEIAYREAVLNSQLHSFAAMVFGKAPTEVTDSEIHQFLRIFVFVPAIGSAFAATLIALMSVHRIRTETAPAELVDDAGQYILEPFAQTIIREAAAAATKAAHDTIVATKESTFGRRSFSQVA